MLKKRKKGIFSSVSPAVSIVVSFLGLILLGALLLMLPIATRHRVATGFTDCLFTATSATCVTGLVVKDTYNYWSVFGQTIILVLLQTGGLGLITITLFVGSFLKRKFGLKDLSLASESVSYNSLPEVWTILRMVVMFSFVIEAMGAIILMPAFVNRYGSGGIFRAIFISISAYCNAGFDLMGSEGAFSSLISFQDSPVVLITVMALIVIGGLGVLVWYDLFGTFKKRGMMLHSSLVFKLTGALILFGAVIFFMSEYYNPGTIGNMDLGGKILNSVFQSITTRTAGFSTVGVANLFTRTKVLFCLLMFIGAAPGSTGGGIKITTFWVVVMTIWSFLRGRQDTVIGGKKIRSDVVYRALTIMILMLAMVFTSAAIIFSNEIVVQEISPMDTLFEVFSAAGTVGLSCDLTPTLLDSSKYILMANMFLGRVGLVTFALAVTTHRATRNKNEILPEGKIIVG
ncbi:MAG TPA: potassium transporter TrkG [Oscillospiraceae bacterium]|nr:potassium transporter TrkG [Oscillospiraceae bacterium]HPF55514.1 potassium transporter TrkG [Clostridiales bacterium]HPK35866.1 potassium transporter TrkG [Oscillospiraceae bacterium]HPR76575.1 potassium transporter TrkG [Oscillospiraceae bacterium]